MIDSHCHLADDVFARRPRRGDRAGEGRPGSSGCWSFSKPATQQEERAGGRGARALARDPRGGRRPSAPGAAVRRQRARRGRHRARAGRRDAVRARGRRDRARLPLRLLAARCPAGGLPRAGAARARARSCRSSFTRARQTRTRSTCCASAGGGEVRGVLHCFTGTRELATAALDLGFYISLAGIVTFPKALGAAGDRAGRSARSAADRNRQSVSGAGAASRQAQRAGADGAHG